MATVKDIFAAIDRVAPFDTQLDFDRAGFLVGDGNAEVTKALIALDATVEVIDEAVAGGFELIITHHPVIWNPLKKLMSSSIPYKLAQHGLSVISAHTNLDGAVGGVNDCLANVIGLENCRHSENAEIGTVGELTKPMKVRELAKHVKESLGCEAVEYIENDRDIRRLAVIGGAGADLAISIFEADEADAVLTGEAKHNELLDAAAAGRPLIIAGHHLTEVVVLQPLADILARELTDVQFTVSAAKAPTRFV